MKVDRLVSIIMIVRFQIVRYLRRLILNGSEGAAGVIVAVQAGKKNVVAVFQPFHGIAKGTLCRHAHPMDHQDSRCGSVAIFQKCHNNSPLCGDYTIQPYRCIAGFPTLLCHVIMWLWISVPQELHIDLLISSYWSLFSLSTIQWILPFL